MLDIPLSTFNFAFLNLYGPFLFFFIFLLLKGLNRAGVPKIYAFFIELGRPFSVFSLL